MRALIIAALLCAPGVRAQEAPRPQQAREERPKLSEEDEELVKELALLERMELVKNLELFEEDKKPGEDKPSPQLQP